MKAICAMLTQFEGCAYKDCSVLTSHWQSAVEDVPGDTSTAAPPVAPDDGNGNLLPKAKQSN